MYLCFSGAVILLGRTNMFRFNHPKEAAKLREKRKVRGIHPWRFSIKHMTCLLIYLLFLFSRAACSPVWAYPCLICPNPVKTSLQSCCITLGKPPRVCVCVCTCATERAVSSSPRRLLFLSPPPSLSSQEPPLSSSLHPPLSSCPPAPLLVLLMPSALKQLTENFNSSPACQITSDPSRNSQ